MEQGDPACCLGTRESWGREWVQGQIRGAWQGLHGLWGALPLSSPDLVWGEGGGCPQVWKGGHSLGSQDEVTLGYHLAQPLSWERETEAQRREEDYPNCTGRVEPGPLTAHPGACSRLARVTEHLRFPRTEGIPSLWDFSFQNQEKSQPTRTSWSLNFLLPSSVPKGAKIWIPLTVQWLRLCLLMQGEHRIDPQSEN